MKQDNAYTIHASLSDAYLKKVISGMLKNNQEKATITVKRAKLKFTISIQEEAPLVIVIEEKKVSFSVRQESII